MSRTTIHRHRPSSRSSIGGRGRKIPRIPGAVLVLVLANVAVFFVQHLTQSGYQKLVPKEARGKADSIAEQLRTLGEARLARSLEDRLHVIGEVKRLSDTVSERTAEQEARLSFLKSRSLAGNDATSRAEEVALGETRLLALKNIGEDAKSLPVLLGSDHEAGGVSLQDLRERRFWTLITHLFIHGSAVHLSLNMIVLAAAGSFAAMCLGTRHFLALYFLGGLVGAALQISFFPNVYLIGASAGVYAVTIAALVLLPEDTFYRFRIPLRPRFVAIGVTVVALAMLGWTLMSGAPGIAFIERVAHLAHLGGIMVGWYYLKMLGVEPREPTPRCFETRMESRTP
jgi:membrane associated rhomboid family serine protease